MLKQIKEYMNLLKYLNYKSRFLLIAGIFFVLFIGNVNLFDWDEINFAEAAREMIVTGDFLNVRIDYEPFHEKPPLFIWIQVISMKIFGINETAARLPNVIIGIITLAVLMNIGKKVYDEKFGELWALAYFGSLLPHFYFKSSIIDPLFNLFMFCGVYYLYQFTSENILTGKKNDKYIYMAGLLTSMAFLTKGPVGFLLVFLTWAIFWGFHAKTFKLPLKQILVFTGISFLPAVIWYAAIFLQHGGGLIGEFIAYQIRLLTTGDAGHEGPFFYHFLVVFLGCFPASLFIFRAFRKNENDNTSQLIFKIFNIILLFTVLIIFSIVKTKIVHYSSLAYFPVTFLAAYTMHKIINGQIKSKISTVIGVGIFGIIFSILFIGFPLLLMNIKHFLPQITDKFTNALLQADVNWSGYEIIVGIVMLMGTFLFWFYSRKQAYSKSYYAIFISTAVCILLFLPLMAPKIETYTQRAPIDFFKSLKGKDVYVHTPGYQSYAPFFYQQKEYKNSKYYLKMNGGEYEEFLLTGNIRKPAYFSARINNYENYTAMQPKLKELYRKNGFVFLKRDVE